MSLSPSDIKKKLDKIGRSEALTLLKGWITNSNDLSLRKEALNLIGSIDNGREFRFFEHLFISDENIDIRVISGRFLKEKYVKNKEIVPLLEFTLNKIKNYEQKFLAVEILNVIDTRNTRKIIKNYLKTYIKTNLQDKIKKAALVEELFLEDSTSSIPQKTLDICFNLILYDYFTNDCGYNVSLRNGFIILLSLEGFNTRNIRKIPALNKLINLEHLIIQRSNIERIDGLEELRQLRFLNLSGNKIKKIENLQILKRLEEIDLSKNEIKRIENVDSLKSLKKINLEFNLINNITGLERLCSLEELNLSNNNIVEIKNLESLTKLKRLNLSNNKIEKISGLERLENVIFLILNGNTITEIEGLNALRNLKALYLSNNQIERITNLDTLVNLEKLEVSNNKIRKIEGLKYQTKLYALYLDDNNIRKLEGLSNLTNLNQLYLVNNQISDYNKDYINTLDKLYYIFLSGNPLTPESWLCYKNKMTRFP